MIKSRVTACLLVVELLENFSISSQNIPLYRNIFPWYVLWVVYWIKATKPQEPHGNHIHMFIEYYEFLPTDISFFQFNHLAFTLNIFDVFILNMTHILGWVTVIIKYKQHQPACKQVNYETSLDFHKSSLRLNVNVINMTSEQFNNDERSGWWAVYKRLRIEAIGCQERRYEFTISSQLDKK